ncbi:MAG: hypothetical protein DRP79_01830 [Planctomycetota bacterium]|nr:MAG: hypothetical protein DRP79_01830 [Planctomycetota bacterium]
MKDLFQKAFDEGRDFLTERESYAMFAALGLDVPRHELIPDGAWLRGRLHEIKKEYPERVVLKVASPDIHHKTEIGGVAVVDNNADAIAGAFDAITTRAREAMPDARLEGALLMEYVQCEQELLVSLIDDPTFGYMLSVGKGGTLTEIFKDIAMRPAPVEKANVEAMVKSLKTYPLLKGYRGTKKADIGQIADFVTTISLLARPAQKSRQKAPAPFCRGFEVVELEINPLAITKDGRVLPIDSILRFRKTRPEEPDIAGKSSAPNEKNLDQLFHPKTIALIGASDTTEKMGGSILKLLIESGAAKVFPVNPKRKELMGLKAYKSISEIPGPIDLAVLAIPAKFTLPVVTECAEAGVKVAIVISGGFGETGTEGKKIEAQMAASARKTGMRIIGPNCMGVYFEPTKFSTFFLSPEKTEIPHCDVNNFTVLSQSGAVCVQMVELTRNVGIRGIVSYGNMIDVDVADLMAYFDRDSGTDVIGIYIEGLTDGAKFISAAKAMHKPVIITKGGKSRAGSAATVSHTGAIAGDYDIAKAVFKSTGLVEAETLEDFADYAKAFSFLHGRRPKGHRLGVISNAGGLAVLAADATEGTCLKMAKYCKATIEAIKAETGGLVIVSNPTDLTAGISDEGFAKAAAHILDDENVDALILIPGIQPRPMREDAIVDEIIRLYNRYDKPMAVTITPTEKRLAMFNRLEAARVPHYDTPERAVRALAAFVELLNGVENGAAQRSSL